MYEIKFSMFFIIFVIAKIVGERIMLEIKNLYKSYGSRIIIENWSYQFQNGKIYGLIGRNGIGKTTIAILGNILVAYDFCLTMYREDIKLYPFGFIDQYNFKTILITKLPVYSLASIIIMIPMIFVLKKYSWCILVLAVLTPLLGVVKSFFFLSLPGQRKVEFNKNLLRK